VHFLTLRAKKIKSKQKFNCTKNYFSSSVFSSFAQVNFCDSRRLVLLKASSFSFGLVLEILSQKIVKFHVFVVLSLIYCHIDYIKIYTLRRPQIDLQRLSDLIDVLYNLIR